MTVLNTESALNGEINSKEIVALQASSPLAYGVVLHSFGMLLPKDKLCEVVANPTIASMPNAPDFFRGLMALRGDLVPVYSLAPFLSSPPYAQLLSPYVIVFGQGEQRAAICCETPPQALSCATLMPINNVAMPINNIKGLPFVLKPLFGSCYLHAGRYWFEMQFETLFTYLSDSLFLR